MQLGRKSVASPHRRRAFTLLELLLVMALLALIASLTMPQIAWLLGDQRLVRGGNLLREEMMRARIEAMRGGRIMVVEAQVDTSNIRVRPYFSLADSVNAIDQTGSQAALLSGAEQAQIAPVTVDQDQQEESERTIELPEDVSVANVAVVSSVRALEIEQATLENQAEGYGQPILFYPDGTTSTAAIVLTHEVHGRLSVKLRGITGDVSLGELGANP
ncbi:MAG: prepilin-type N-terminal cleavage/methylation domain-containing protein [Planctomycetota bacterium]